MSCSLSIISHLKGGASKIYFDTSPILVHPWGVEPQSSEPESDILSIELWVRLYCKGTHFLLLIKYFESSVNVLSLFAVTKIVTSLLHVKGICCLFLHRENIKDE